MRKYYLFYMLLMLAVCVKADVLIQEPTQVNCTTGTPLGGFGCGGVKFDANTGMFATMTTPPADAYDFQLLKEPRLELTVDGQRTERLKAHRTADGRADDDAIWPLHRVTLAGIGGVEVGMTGYSPLDNKDYQNMHLPYALYEVTLTNTSAEPHLADFRFVWKNTEDAELAEDTEKVSWCLLSDGEGTVTLQPGEKKRIRYVLAWYNHEDTELGYYMNLYSNPRDIARHGMTVFDRLKGNAERLVSGMRGSNLPHWLQNQTLNTLSACVLNGMYKRDGRLAFAEGQWTCFGTMDQMWLARHVFYQLLPDYAWQELSYWARTQMKNGQIHHDFNKMDVGRDRARRYLLCPWDDTEHQDYRDVQKWVDLNAGFIISVYEAYRATANRERFLSLWPNVKRAAEKMLRQVRELGNQKYPYNFDGSENSYDAGGNPDPYNANISALAYRIVSELANETGEEDIARRYGEAYDTVRRSFAQRYIVDKDNMMGKHCENVFTGQQMALHLQIGEIWSEAETDSVLARLERYYYPRYWGLGYPAGTYDEWTPYLLIHYGGLLLNTGHVDDWLALQKDAYERQYLDRERLFDHPLNVLPIVKELRWTSRNIKSKKQYISIPSLWRNYTDIVGFHRDARTAEVWLKPILLPDMGGKLDKGYFFCPMTDGTIDYQETADGAIITLRTTEPLTINAIHLADQFDGKVTVSVDGRKCKAERKGTGYAKELVVQWQRTTGQPLRIEMKGKRIAKPIYTPARPDRDFSEAFKLSDLSPFEPMPAVKADKLAGTEKAQNADGSEYLTSCNNFDYIQFSNVDFARGGTTHVVFRIRTTFSDSELEVVLDDTAGQVVGSYKLPSTNGEWRELEFPIQKITKVHNVILRFFGSRSESLMDVEWVKFR